MIPIRLKIKGFLSFRDPVELDFTSFNLACIAGENGAGKSSLLDAVTWALFGRARKSDESVINTASDAAEVTLDFDYEGNRYRVQRTNPRGKTSSVEFLIRSQVPGEEVSWKPLTERTLRETDREIVTTLRMDFETFINASFFLQGKADQFATAAPGERKRILSNILGLEVWESYRESAAGQRRQCEKEVRELDGRLNEIQLELDEEPQRVERLAGLQTGLAELSKQREGRAANLENLRRLQALLDEQRKMLGTMQSQLDAAVSSRERIQATLEERSEEKAGYDTALANADVIEKAYQDWEKARQALEDMEEVAAQFRKHEALRHEPLGVIQAEEARLIQEKQGLEEQKQALERAHAEADALNADLQTAREVIKTAETKLAQREQLDADIRQLQADHAEAKAENPRLRDEMNELKGRIEQLQAADGAECPLCGQPLGSDERQALIASLSEKGKGLGDRFRENKALLENFQSRQQGMGAQLADLNSVDAELRAATRRADQIGSQLEAVKKMEETWQGTGVVRLAEIDKLLAEGTFAADARVRLEEIDAELEALGYDLDAHAKLRLAESQGRAVEADLRALEKARAALAPLAREISGLEEQLKAQEKEITNLITSLDEAAAKLAAAEAELPDMQGAESDLHDIQERENILRSDVGAAKQKVTVLETLKERKAGLVEEREELTQRIADLKQLERAFGKDGVPALLIEQALPEIEETANNLLSRLTNGRMNFSFITQRELKGPKRGDLRETLDMVVSDSAGERDYEMFSGGEAFRINFSIRLALSEVLARRAGARLQTLVIDEGFGSQDAQGRQRLVEAINLVREDFAKILVITHLEELKEAFPTRIEVEKTAMGSQIQLIM